LKVEFTGSQQDRLAAAIEMPAGPVRAYALFAHCFTCSKDILAARTISRALAGKGIAVLRFDFTGLGSSEGDFADTSFSSNVDDLVAAAAYLREIHAAPQLLIGHSLGGAAVLAAANRLPEVKAVATINAPSDVGHVVENFAADLKTIDELGEAKVKLAGREFVIKKQFVDDARAAKLSDEIGRMKKALLIFHAPRDQVVSIDHAGAIFTAAKHPKSFVSLDEADHLLSDARDADYVADVLAAWAGRYLCPADAGDTTELPRGTARIAETGNGKFQQLMRVGQHELIADEPASVGGLGSGPTPYDLLSLALGACTSMTLRMYADHKGYDLGRIRALSAQVESKRCLQIS
jgi:putative redox protein